MKKKLENFWFYYKWYVIAGIVAALVAVDMFAQKSQTTEPDMQCSVVGVEDWTEDMSGKLSEQLSEIYGCSFGVNSYMWGGETVGASSPADVIADSVHLSADISGKISLFYITDADDFADEAGLVLFAEAGGTVLELPETLTVLCREEDTEKLKEIRK